ncbi:hypothetical protein SAMN02799616_00947 [Paenibacillus sp. UNC499MF]|nr:hypothetical protein SAMN02799616_00947 [Paenibacillus sp. UNC499MF]
MFVRLDVPAIGLRTQRPLSIQYKAFLLQFTKNGYCRTESRLFFRTRVLTSARAWCLFAPNIRCFKTSKRNMCAVLSCAAASFYLGLSHRFIVGCRIVLRALLNLPIVRYRTVLRVLPHRFFVRYRTVLRVLSHVLCALHPPIMRTARFSGKSIHKRIVHLLHQVIKRKTGCKSLETLAGF